VVRKGTTARLESPIASDADDRQALLSVAAFYHGTLKESPEALRYPESRGLTDPETIDRFQLGLPATPGGGRGGGLNSMAV